MCSEWFLDFKKEECLQPPTRGRTSIYFIMGTWLQVQGPDYSLVKQRINVKTH